MTFLAFFRPHLRPFWSLQSSANHLVKPSLCLLRRVVVYVPPRRLYSLTSHALAYAEGHAVNRFFASVLTALYSLLFLTFAGVVDIVLCGVSKGTRKKKKTRFFLLGGAQMPQKKQVSFRPQLTEKQVVLKSYLDRSPKKESP